jgi:TolA-binding protein
METASGKYGIGLCMLVLASAYTAGCSIDMQNVRQPVTAADEIRTGDEQAAGTESAPESRGDRVAAGTQSGSDTGGQRLTLSARPAPLPRQAYDASGVKIPYAAQPNPYTTGSAPVPAEARALFSAADVQLKQGALDRAQEKFATLAEKYPDLSGPWVKLGEIAEDREQYAQAVGYYREAISRNKNNVNAYIALGMVQRRLGRFNDAQDTYLAALDVWKDFPEAHLNLAILYDLYADEAEAAQKHYEAYDFLTGSKDQDVQKWLVEVRNRTGITTSYIDTPPVALDPIEVGDAGKGNVATAK